MSVEENMRLMKTLDDAWNAQDWDTLNKRHTEDVAVYWWKRLMVISCLVGGCWLVNS